MLSNDIVVKAEAVSKAYAVYNKPIDRLLQLFTSKQLYREFWALKNVSFEIKKGETIAIIGQNGSGKSTLLQLLSSILTPTSGNITVNGRIAALLELGAGFNPEFTGKENIYMNAAILGLSKEQTDERYQDIVDFADIGEFVNRPVKTYSSGMYVRLAFSVAVHVEPEILIVDEALAVGDMYFQAKCVEKMKSLQQKCSILFVSHSLHTVRQFCQRAILLEHGHLILDGDVKTVTQHYENKINQRFATDAIKNIKDYVESDQEEIQSGPFEVDSAFEKRTAQFRSGTGEAKFIRADIYVNDKPAQVISIGDRVKLRLLAKYYKDADAGGTIGYTIRNQQGVDVIGCNSFNLKKELPAMKAGQILEATFEFVNILAPGDYTVSLGLKPAPIQPVFFDVVNIAQCFTVPGVVNNYVPGMVYLDHLLTCKTHNS